ncbi:serine/threonine-protein phosphatase 2A regulatory subunit B'' subunit alpha isoform X1 [Synchiropus splendidus]|uniref:serine/threonine-protein phosphatase 2A regulatory subunit B'' subunit alpha isoform X1 n=1 Tax=Synchiropus splendidus TaxID=270530 RepID=UPI00237E78AF|nr:serine/threonine-protein phosphatase 2A regulatory subunit B'' subunit alpha isoform X1 [Synchiropus splendidus]
MAAAYRVVVSSVSCYNSVVVDRRSHSHAVHYCAGPCGAQYQGLDCAVAHHGTCSELLVAPEPNYSDSFSSAVNSRITQQLPTHGKLTMDSSYSASVALERAGSAGNLALGDDSPIWKGKKIHGGGGSTGNLSSAGSLKDITEEAINLASGKLKEFSFDKLRLSSSHVTLRKGRKVRPDSFNRRSADLELIYGHFSSNVTTNGSTNGMTNGTANSNDENQPPFILGKGLDETKLKDSGTLSTITKLSGGSSNSLSSICSGTLEQSLNTVASLYRNTLGEENVIARLLEKTWGEAGTGGAGGEDIRACLDILLKCSEDLKKCTDIIKQCIRRKAGGGPEDGTASPDSVYRAMMSRLSSYLKRLPLELEGIGNLGSQNALGSGHSDLAELVNTLHSIQQGPYSPIFGNEQPPRYEDVVQSPPIPKSHSASPTPSSVCPSSPSPSKFDHIHTAPVQSSFSRAGTLSNGLQHSQSLSFTQHTLSPPSVTSSSNSSPAHSPSLLRRSPTPPYTHTPPPSPMEALYIEEDDSDFSKTPDLLSQPMHMPIRGEITTNSQNGTVSQKSQATYNSSSSLPVIGPSSTRSSSVTQVSTQKSVSHRNEDIDKLLMDLENLSQSMSHPRTSEPPLPAKMRKRDGDGRMLSESVTQPKMLHFPGQQTPNHLSMNGRSSRTPQGLMSTKLDCGDTPVGEEEDGALLMRILESIESFAQELVDSGPGSTGSAERKCGKEREVMRLLQDNLAGTGRGDTPVDMSAIPETPCADTVPALPPKNSFAQISETSLVQTHTPVENEPELPPSYFTRLLAVSSSEPLTDVADNPLDVSTNSTEPEVPSVKSPSSNEHSNFSPKLNELPEPERQALTDGGRDAAVADDDPAPATDSSSTLLIQQTPEVIRVQSKPEKKPATPPPAPPTLTAVSPTPPPHSPSPPPAPVVVTPPPPAINIPRFYYPRGLPALGPTASNDAAISSIEAVFTEFEEEKADIYEMGKIAKACGCPLYWKAPMFYAAGGDRTGFVSVHSFIATWRKLLHSCHDDASKFIYMLAKPGCNYLEQEDFIPLMQDIVDTHPGLTFLKDAPEFHSRYITTVIQRIYYIVNRSWTGRMTMMELRRSNFLQTLALLEEEDDINQITDYFSYEHFYVIYCKFWELDTDHDLYIDHKDLARYNDHASSNRIIERLFSGAVTRGNAVQREGRMSYAEFVWFLISEEDKKNLTSIEYWFRCMDVDGDGVLSMYELEYFYEEQCERMERMGIEPLPFQDLLCQMLDLVKPECSGKITLSDLKRCRMAHIFFDTFFNLEKYLDHEQRDPFAVQKDVDSEGPEPSDWDKYAAEEYEILVAEETANEQLHEGSFDDDYESEELPVSGDVGNKMDKLVISDLTA